MHLADLQAAITNARNFEAAKLKANHLTIRQSINLHTNIIIKKTQIVSRISRIYYYQPINSDNRKFVAISSELPTYNAAATLLTTSISSANLLINDTSNISAVVTNHLLTTASGNLSAPTNSNTVTELTSKQNPKAKINSTKLEIIDGKSQQWNLGTKYTQNPNSQNYLSLLVTSEDASPNTQEPNQKQPLISNILPTTIIEDESLTAIFPFEIEEPLETSLFSGATLEKKPITVMYTDAKIDGQSIKLILDSGSAGSIITRQLIDQLATKTSIGEIDVLLIEVNSIIVLIKILVMEATQYQALLQLSQNGQHTCIPTMCGHFKPITTPTAPLIKFEEEKEKSVLWADSDHNELPLILFWDNNNKEKQKEELTWNTDQAWKIDND
ncbi:hypothetical protein G9A89_016174 [Geosiphon pyriformis]|nr:hypothetical protein G9A89_016174 [Geosiphon pyriformis]